MSKGPYGGFEAEDLSIKVNEGCVAMGLGEGFLATDLGEGFLATDLGEGFSTTVLSEGFSAKGMYPKDCCRWIFVINIRVHCNFSLSTFSLENFRERLRDYS